MDESHSHSASEVGAAEDNHYHYVSEIRKAVHQRDLDELTARVRALEDSLQEARRQLAGEARTSRLIIPAIASAIRSHAESLAKGGALAPGQDIHGFNQESFLKGHLLKLASGIEGLR